MTKEDRINELLCNIDDNDIITWWNDTYSPDGEDIIRYMDELDDYLRDWSPSEIIDNVVGNDFTTNDDYFVDGIYGLESFSNIYNVVDNNILIDYIIENDEDFGDEDIRAILDDEDDEEE